MSEIKVDTLTGKTSAGDITITSGSATMQLQQGLAKAWVNFNGIGTVAVRDSLNASSIQDNGTGYYSLNFLSSTANINYSVSGGTNGTNNSFPTGASTSGDIRFHTSNASPYKVQPTTSAFTITVSQDLNMGVPIDIEWASANIHGDLS